MGVITIARQLGAGGETIAHRVADALGWRLLDRALVERIAEELEAAPEQVEAANERVENFVERLGLYLAEALPEMHPMAIPPPVSPDATAEAARRVVAAVAQEGPAVIVGHAAQLVLRDRANALHVLVHAPMQTRVRRAMEHFGLDERAATERIRRSDADRKRYVREHWERDWLDPTLYHLCIDTGAFGIDGAAELIQEAARRVLDEEETAAG
ncbi:MAG TPA: cytidylate kinase-like family protein [Longimicrobium sp.]|nr:cytidylate kinase-like family protein [Longimicrobium sp.]